jgi:hypothetical protein
VKAVYGEREVKVIAVLREPGARLHAAFWNFDHYQAGAYTRPLFSST